MNLRFRVNLAISLIGFACVAVMIFVLIDYKRKSIGQEIEAGTRVSIQLLQSILLSPVYSSEAPESLTSLTQYLRNVGRVRANEVRLYDSDNTLVYESPPSEYKQGRWAPQWFSTLVAPDVGEVRLLLSEGSILITPDSSRSVLDAWDELVRFALFFLVFFLLLNVAVFRVLGRTMQPLKDIVMAMSEMEQGKYSVRLKNYDLPEFNAIGHTFNSMAASLEEALTTERELEQSRKLTQLIHVKLEEERRAIARELHDELGQCVTAIKTIGTAIANREDHKHDETRNNARTIVEVASHIYDVVHSMIRKLRPSALDHLGLSDAIGELVAQYQRQHPQLGIRLNAAAELNHFDEKFNITVYRVVQECLTNVVKHAEASQVTVSLALVHDKLQICVSDDGKGLSAEFSEGRRFGMLGIKERVHAFGGEVLIESTPDRGTLIVATLPFIAPESP
ncbi:MAG: histidine kinase [Pseudohongiella sp.]|nr:histidine kinase [Pseudohongiella sp.]MDO9520807.1 histidine kinase [Pseudohongiella sp.]MDP2128130.1 histidine kinase [Pseudohongiella sp.]